MRAAIYERYGGPDVLHVAEVPDPLPRAGQVLVRVHAAEVTKGDCELRSMRFAVQWFVPLLRVVWGIRRPRKRILGGYFAGTIASGAFEPGSDGRVLGPGDAVFGTAGVGVGAYGELLVLPANAAVAHKPAALSFEQASALGLGGLNALHFLTLADVRAGQRVLVNGAGGSIGSFAVQIAKARGAHVTAVDAAHKAELLVGLGAHVFLDYAKDDVASVQTPFDVVFDMVAGSDFNGLRRLLTAEGRYLTGNPTLLRMLQCAWLSLRGRQRGHFAFARETRAELEALVHMVDAGALRVVLDGTYDLEEVAAAHRRVESEARVGMVALGISTPEF